jgi:hypothetical protein
VNDGFTPDDPTPERHLGLLAPPRRIILAVAVATASSISTGQILGSFLEARRQAFPWGLLLGIFAAAFAISFAMQRPGSRERGALWIAVAVGWSVPALQLLLHRIVAVIRVAPLICAGVGVAAGILVWRAERKLAIGGRLAALSTPPGGSPLGGDETRSCDVTPARRAPLSLAAVSVGWVACNVAETIRARELPSGAWIIGTAIYIAVGWVLFVRPVSLHVHPRRWPLRWPWTPFFGTVYGILIAGFVLMPLGIWNDWRAFPDARIPPHALFFFSYAALVGFFAGLLYGALVSLPRGSAAGRSGS